MRHDEAFAAHALVEFFGGPSYVSASDGENPPDLYLNFSEYRVGVEVTWLSPVTFESDGTLGNRLTQDAFGIRLLDELDTEIGPSLPDNISMNVGLWLPVSNPSRFRKGLTDWVREVAEAPKKGLQQVREIEGSKAKITVISERPSGKKILGYVFNKNSSTDICLNARLLLEGCIRKKSGICASLARPIWLALLNDYWLADADTYATAYRQLKLTHHFERIFLVSYKGEISEIAGKA